MTKEEKILHIMKGGSLHIDREGRVWRIVNNHEKYEIKTFPGAVEPPRVSGVYQGKQTRCLIYRLVWAYFNGPILEGKVIHHIDGNRFNNHIDNLVCVTIQEHVALHYKKPRGVAMRKPKTDRTQAAPVNRKSGHKPGKGGRRWGT